MTDPAAIERKWAAFWAVATNERTRLHQSWSTVERKRIEDPAYIAAWVIRDKNLSVAHAIKRLWTQRTNGLVVGVYQRAQREWLEYCKSVRCHPQNYARWFQAQEPNTHHSLPHDIHSLKYETYPDLIIGLGPYYTDRCFVNIRFDQLTDHRSNPLFHAASGIKLPKFLMDIASVLNSNDHRLLALEGGEAARREAVEHRSEPSDTKELRNLLISTGNAVSNAFKAWANDGVVANVNQIHARGLISALPRFEQWVLQTESAKADLLELTRLSAYGFDKTQIEARAKEDISMKVNAWMTQVADHFSNGGDQSAIFETLNQHLSVFTAHVESYEKRMDAKFDNEAAREHFHTKYHTKARLRTLKLLVSIEKEASRAAEHIPIANKTWKTLGRCIATILSSSALDIKSIRALPNFTLVDQSQSYQVFKKRQDEALEADVNRAKMKIINSIRSTVASDMSSNTAAEQAAYIWYLFHEEDKKQRLIDVVTTNNKTFTHQVTEQHEQFIDSLKFEDEPCMFVDDNQRITFIERVAEYEKIFTTHLVPCRDTVQRKLQQELPPQTELVPPPEAPGSVYLNWTVDETSLATLGIKDDKGEPYSMITAREVLRLLTLPPSKPFAPTQPAVVPAKPATSVSRQLEICRLGPDGRCLS